MTFTEHVRTFGRDCDPTACVFPNLEDLLRRRMRRRHLLSAPPSYLGYDAASWTAAGAFDEIVLDCYHFAVLARLRGLTNQLRRRDDIDGLITRNVDNFLTKRQQEHDPIGYSVYANVRAAAEHLVAGGTLRVRETGRYLSAAALLDLAPDAENPTLAAPDVLASAVAAAGDWFDVLPALVEPTEHGQVWVAGLLEGLRAAGCQSVRVSDLVAAVATRARADWAARHAPDVVDVVLGRDAELADLVRAVQSDGDAGFRDMLAALRRLVPERIAAEGQERVRTRLAAVFDAWIRLTETAAAPPTAAEIADQCHIPATSASDALARLFRICRELMPESG